MAESIGYQDGITAFFDWYRKQPNVPKRGPGYNPDDLSTWPWVDKMERTLRILKDDHDAAVVTPPPSGGGGSEPPPSQTYKKVAPRVAYKTDRADARYCLFNPDGSLRPGVTQRSDGKFADESGAVYTDGDGLDESGRRSGGSANDCPTSASNIDGRSYCSLPMQGDPTKNTGSWLI